MFTAFDRTKLLEHINYIKSRSYKQSQQGNIRTTNTDNIFISESQLPERSTIITIRFSSLFYKQSKHIIDTDKMDSLIDTFSQYDINNVYSGILVQFVTNLKSSQYDKYRTKTGKIMLPCLNDIEQYCPLCNILQTMRNIKSCNLEQLNQSSRYYEIVEMIHKLSDIITSTIYRIEELVLPCLIVNEHNNQCSMKFVTINNKENFNKIASAISEKMKEEGYLISDIAQVSFRLLGHSEGDWNFVIEDIQDIRFNDDVNQLVNQLGIRSEFNDFRTNWDDSRIRAMLYKRTMKLAPDIDSDFSSLVDNTIDMIVEETKTLIEQES